MSDPCSFVNVISRVEITLSGVKLFPAFLVDFLALYFVIDTIYRQEELICGTILLRKYSYCF